MQHKTAPGRYKSGPKIRWSHGRELGRREWSCKGETKGGSASGKKGKKRRGGEGRASGQAVAQVRKATNTCKAKEPKKRGGKKTTAEEPP